MKAELKEETATYFLFYVEGSLSVQNLPVFENLLNKHKDLGKHFIIDFNKVTFVDSSSLGVLIMHYRRLKEIDKLLILINLPHDINQLFEITGLVNRVTVLTNMGEALEYIKDK